MRDSNMYYIIMMIIIEYTFTNSYFLVIILTVIPNAYLIIHFVMPVYRCIHYDVIIHLRNMFRVSFLKLQ